MILSYPPLQQCGSLSSRSMLIWRFFFLTWFNSQLFVLTTFGLQRLYSVQNPLSSLTTSGTNPSFTATSSCSISGGSSLSVSCLCAIYTGLDSSSSHGPGDMQVCVRLGRQIREASPGSLLHESITSPPSHQQYGLSPTWN